MSDYQKLLAELPSDWHTLPIEDIGEVISGGTPSRGNPRYWGGEIPWVTPGEVTGSGRKHLEETDEKITAEGLAQSGAKLLPANSLLVTTRASLGAAMLNAAPATTNQGFKSIAFIKHFSPDYYYHWSMRLKDELVRLASGTTFLEISGSHFRKIAVPAPPRAEQVKIARILDTLDTQIHKTEALITKLEKVKEGLLHDLLTRGIDENSQLRSSPDQAPELYKNSPLGLIPRGWEARPLLTVVKEMISGAAIKSGEFSETGKPVIAKSDVTGSKLIDIENRDQFVSLQAASLYSRSMVDENAVVVSLRDLVPSGPTVGMGSIFYGKNFYILAQGTYGLYLKADLMTREFFCEVTRRSWFRSQARGITVGSTQVHARSSEYVGITIPIPTLHEQIAINERIRSLDESISAENRALSEASDLKKGLMDDLLTGRVRVTPLLDQAQATTPA